MPKIGNTIAYVDRPCDRCGSKRKISKTWTEKIKNPNSTMVLENTQVVCTNKECQEAFDRAEMKEKEKREKRKPANTTASKTEEKKEEKKVSNKDKSSKKKSS